MPLNLTKIAFGAQSYADIESWYEGGTRSPFLTTKYRPTKWEQCIGGSLYWIHQHSIVARSVINGFSQTDSGRWLIELEPELIRVSPRPQARASGLAIPEGRTPARPRAGRRYRRRAAGQACGEAGKAGAGLAFGRRTVLHIFLVCRPIATATS